MKKSLLLVCLCASLALVLAGCAGGGAAASSAAASSAAAEEAASSEASAEESSEANTNMANPWTDVATAEEAASGAGVGSFSTPVGMEETLLGPIPEEWASFRCMDGIAEAHFPVAAVEMTVRKGLASAATDGDISGDYTEYANTWTTTAAGKEVTCAGNREGESTRTIWTDGDYCYSILAIGAGGDTDFGLNAEMLEEFVGAVS